MGCFEPLQVSWHLAEQAHRKISQVSEAKDSAGALHPVQALSSGSLRHTQSYVREYELVSAVPPRRNSGLWWSFMTASSSNSPCSYQ